MHHYLIFETLCPLFMSLLIIIFNSNRLGQYFSSIVAILNTAFLFPIYETLISSKNSITYLLGGYENSYGIELKLNFYSFIFLAIINISFFIFSIYKLSIKDISKLENTLILLCIAGFNGIIMSNDLFNIYVFLELASIASYGLLASSGSLPTLKAAFNYLIFGTIGASFYLIGIAFIYILTGSLNISIITERTMIYDGYSSGFIWLSFFFITLGFFIKLGLFPLHKWLIEVYSKSKSQLTMFFSFSSSTISLYLLTLFLFNVYGVWNTEKFFKINDFLQFTGIFAAIYFGYKAFTENENKKILIYSSFAQIGYMLNTIGFTYTAHDKTSINSFILQLITNAISKPVLFLLFSEEIINNLVTERKRITHLVVSSFLILNLLGVPPLLGFFGKFTMILSIIKNKSWLNLAMISINLFKENVHKTHNNYEKSKTVHTYSYIYEIIPMILVCGAVFAILIFSNYLNSILLLATNNLLLIR